MPSCIFPFTHRETWKHTRVRMHACRAIALSFPFCFSVLSLSFCCFLSHLFLLSPSLSLRSSKGRLFSACCSLGSKWLWMQIRFKNRHTHTHTQSLYLSWCLEKDECRSRNCGRGNEGKSNWGERWNKVKIKRIGSLRVREEWTSLTLYQFLLCEGKKDFVHVP